MHQMMYCIPHGKMVDAEMGPITNTPLHLEWDNLDELEWCEGPFAYSPPPDEDSNEYYDWLFSNEDAIQDLLDYEVAQ